MDTPQTKKATHNVSSFLCDPDEIRTRDLPEASGQAF